MGQLIYRMTCVQKIFKIAGKNGMNLASSYRHVYGTSSLDGVPIPSAPDNTSQNDGSDIFISQDLVVAAPLWHDWAKPIVFQ